MRQPLSRFFRIPRIAGALRPQVVEGKRLSDRAFRDGFLHQTVPVRAEPALGKGFPSKVTDQGRANIWPELRQAVDHGAQLIRPLDDQLLGRLDDLPVPRMPAL